MSDCPEWAAGRTVRPLSGLQECEDTGYDPIGGAIPCVPGAADPTSHISWPPLPDGKQQLHVWYVMAAFPANSCPRLKTLGFRIRYDPSKVYVDAAKSMDAYDVAEVSVVQKVPSDQDGTTEFPGPDTGVAMGFRATRTSRLQELWWFVGYSYPGAVDATFGVSVLSGLPGDNGMFRDDAIPVNKELIAGFGRLGLGGAIGENPTAIPQDPSGSCCVPAGTCTVTTEANCIAGTWTLSGRCSPNICPAPNEPGACCDLQRGCAVTLPADCALPSQWHAGWLACDPNPCPEMPNVAHCDFVATGLPYIVMIDYASKDGGSLVYGDVVGLFATYQDRWICVGSAPYEGNWPLSVPAMEADPDQGLPGFVPGGPIVLELCASSGDSLVGTPYWRQNGTYGATPYSAASYVEFRSPWCHREIPLQANRWEWIGLGLLPENSNAGNVFGDLGSNLRIAKDDEGHVYIPGVYDNLSPLGVENGYALFLGDSPATLEVTGSLPSLEQDCIPIAPNRWNLIPYLTDSCGVACALDIGQAMEAWADSTIMIVQTDAGDVWIREQSVDTIGMLDPRLGYYLFPRATTSFGICYPSCLHGAGRAAAGPGAGAPVLCGPRPMTVKVPTSLEQPSFYSVQETGMPEIVLVTETSDGSLSDGDEIAVLCDGRVVGAARFQGSLPFVIPVWRGSADMGLAGFTPGAPMTAELWDRETGRQIALAPVTEDGQSATFRFEPYSRVRLDASGTSAVSGTLATGDPAILRARPNPSRDVVEIACRLSRVGDIPELEIYDSAGRLIRRLPGAPREGLLRATWDGTTDAGSRVASGVYFLRLKAGAKGSEQRLLILR